jgi:Calcineurin-like phosphoesterase
MVSDKASENEMPATYVSLVQYLEYTLNKRYIVLFIVEFYETPDKIPPDILVPRAPILALLGDVGLTLRFFLHKQADRFQHVLFLAGNHEFYNCHRNNNNNFTSSERHNMHTVDDQLAWLRNVCRERPNLHFMERQRLELAGAVILATTLWSHIPAGVAELAQRSMNDYRLCYITMNHGHTNRGKKVPMDAAFTNQWHSDSVQWLEHEIARAARRGQSVYVLTHHTPALQGTSAPQYNGSPLTHCFSTDLTHLLQHPVRVWACGHTHYNFNGTFQNNQNGSGSITTTTRLLSNQRGYPNNISAGYDKYGVILKISRPPQKQQS